MSFIDTLKKQGTVSILVISLFLGLIAAGLSVLYLKNREAALELKYRKKPEPMTTVVVPRRNLFPGEAISARTVATLSIPSKYVDNNVVNASNYPKIKGRRLQYQLSKGKPIPLSSLMGVNTKDFSDNIAIGKRGVTIKVDTINSFDGMLRPGNFIDLIIGLPADQAGAPIAPNLENAEEEEVMLPLLDNIKVLATGNDTIGQAKKIFGSNITDSDFTTITINLYPEQAAMLKSAEEVGRIVATLRNRKDKGTSDYELVRPSQLMELISKAKNAALARSSNQVATDANGNVIGKIVGDTVYDAQGNVIGKVDANGNVVDLDGKVIGKKQQGQVALGADGKPIGTIVGDKVYDENGNVIGRVDKNGRIIAPDGQVIGSAAQSIAVDANGNVIGNVVNGVVYDENGNVVGRVDANGNVVAEDGTILGSTVSKIAIGKDGKPIGTIVGDKVYDKDGNLIGRVDKDGNVVDLAGKVIGAVADNVTVADVALDKDGNVIGRIDKDGNVIDENGNIIGTVDENGNIVDKDGNVIGSKAENVLLDANGNVIANELIGANGEVIGKVIGDKVYDNDGNLIGRVDENGNVVDLDGNKIDATVRAGKIDSEINTLSAGGGNAQGASGGAASGVYDSMVGGKAEDGILNINRQTVE